MNKTINSVLVSSILLLSGCIELDLGEEEQPLTDLTSAELDYELISINKNNETTVSKLALNWALNNELASASTATGIIIAPAISPSALPDKEWLITLLNKNPTTPQHATGITTDVNVEVSCLTSGSITFESNVLAYLADAKVTATFNQCHENGIITNGKIITTTNNTSGQLGSDIYSTSASINMSNFSTTENNETHLMNGTFTMDIDVTAEFEATTLSSASIMIEMAGELQNIQNLVSEKILNINTDTVTLEIAADITDKAIGGTVSFNTEEVFQFSGEASDTPYLGTMNITGKSDSNIVINILSGDAIKIEADYNGDGYFDHSETFTWNELSY